MDRTAFKKQTLEKADNTRSYWLTKSPEERLLAAMYLNSIAYNFPFGNPPRLDRTFFQKRTRE
ncbi:MAG: hypothetical protein ACE5FF_01525 [Saprospiraceae bacterium]